jgi:hypothetical protein
MCTYEFLGGYNATILEWFNGQNTHPTQFQQKLHGILTYTHTPKYQEMICDNFTEHFTFGWHQTHPLWTSNDSCASIPPIVPSTDHE